MCTLTMRYRTNANYYYLHTEIQGRIVPSKRSELFQEKMQELQLMWTINTNLNH